MTKTKFASLVSDSHFESLARSALDFLDQAVRQIESAPKYAVINLATAIELFLKARLVKEHWALLVAKPEIASIAAFEDGSFISASPDATISRLREIAAVSLTKEEEACFRRLRQHRNRLVHFYLTEYLGVPTDADLAAIAAEQCRAWYLLQRLLLERWTPHFNQYIRQLEAVRHRVAKNRHFLEGKFLALRSELDDERRRGATFEVCKACGKESAYVNRGGAPVVELSCKVCDRVEFYLPEKCPECGQEVRIEDVGEGRCTACGYAVTLEWLLKKLGPEENTERASVTAYCGSCEYAGTQTVIPTGDHADQLLCVFCLSTHRRIETCKWCGKRVAGANLEDSYAFGCMLCGGRIAHGD